jgi:tetratricopeptide (TPR) repeat protein
MKVPQYYLKAYRVSKKSGLVVDEAICLKNLGVIYSQLKNYMVAEKYYMESLSKIRETSIKMKRQIF